MQNSIFSTQSGRTVGLRQVTTDDRPALVTFLMQLSADTRWLRYLSGRPLILPWAQGEAERMTQGQRWPHVTLVVIAYTGLREEVVAVAELVKVGDASQPASAEIAIVVRDDYQGEGIGRWLAGRLILIAQTVGVTTFSAEIAAQNERMRRILRGMSEHLTITATGGELSVFVHLPQSHAYGARGHRQAAPQRESVKDLRRVAPETSMHAVKYWLGEQMMRLGEWLRNRPLATLSEDLLAG